MPDVRLWFIGDAGGDEPNPVLNALRTAVTGDSTEGLVVAVGDNVYPNGVTEAGASDRAEGERRLMGQIDAGRGARNGILFLPGNHDWGGGTDPAHGVEILAREHEIVRREDGRAGARGGRVRMLPSVGCPGPESVDLGTTIRLVVLDTEWWLRQAAARGTAANGCLTSEREVLDSLRVLLDGAAPRAVVVAAHHPLESVGPHGGRFGWQQHLFPLRELWSPLWVPLPIVGSVYPLAHVLKNSPQDLRSRPYRHYRASIDSVFRTRPPLAYVSGHEHNLQVLGGSAGPLLLVSGAGSRERPSFVSPTEETRFARRANGFMRLDVWKDGDVRLTVLEVDTGGGVCECFHYRVR